MNDIDAAKAFHAKLKADLVYRSPAGPARSWGPFEWARAMAFHYRILRVYSVARRMIRQGAFDMEHYASRSWKSLYETEVSGGRFEITGLGALTRTQGPVVIVGNHMSSLETIVLPGILLSFKDVAFVVKESLETHFIFGPIMRSVKHIAVGRDNPREDLKLVLSRGAELIGQGVSVVIFPQATRSVEFDIDGFNTLGVKLAARTGVPVVPMALKTDFMANGKWVKDMGYVYPGRTVHFAFGEPMNVVANGREEHAAVVKFIAARLNEWGGTIKGTVPA